MWEPNQAHKNLFEKLFKNFNKEKKYKILDLGTGRTSLFLLNKQFPKSYISEITSKLYNKKFKHAPKMDKVQN